LGKGEISSPESRFKAEESSLRTIFGIIQDEMKEDNRELAGKSD
jgi:hypothetical protein